MTLVVVVCVCLPYICACHVPELKFTLWRCLCACIKERRSRTAAVEAHERRVQTQIDAAMLHNEHLEKEYDKLNTHAKQLTSTVQQVYTGPMKSYTCLSLARSLSLIALS
jgi:hypothetical protein